MGKGYISRDDAESIYELISALRPRTVVEIGVASGSGNCRARTGSRPTVAARPWSWVVLHDLNLPQVHPAYQACGAKWLCEAWPFAKVTGGGSKSNICAVQLPDNPKKLIPMATRLLERPWEFPPTR